MGEAIDWKQEPGRSAVRQYVKLTMDEEGLQTCWRDETRRRTSRGGIPNRFPRRYRRGRPIARKISHVLILGSLGRRQQRRADSRRGDAATPVSRGRAAVVPNEGGCRNSFRRGPVSLPTPPLAVRFLATRKRTREAKQTFHHTTRSRKLQMSVRLKCDYN